MIKTSERAKINVYRDFARALVSRASSAFAFACLALVALSAAAATVEYTYDANGRLTGVYAPSGDAAQYVYDPAGNIVQINRFASTTLSIVEFSPAAGPIGAAVNIYGTGFSATSTNDAVTFNGVAATVTSATPNKLTTNVPAGATTGPISVVVGSSTANSATNFTVASGTTVPTITSFSPTVGAPGTAVTISGTNFDPSPALNAITFNSTFATATAASSTSLTTAVPSYAASGALRVRTRDGIATSPTDFLVPFGTIAAADITGSYRAIVDGATAAFSIPSNGKVAYVLFDGVQGQGIGLGVTTSGCVTIYIERPDNLDLQASTSVCGNTSIDLPILPLTGTYAVAIKSATSAIVSGIVTASSDNAGALGAEGTIASFSTTRAGQNGRYTFSGTSGQRAAFYIFNLSASVQASRIDVLLPNKQLLATTTSSGASAFIQVQELPDTGTYTVLVSPQTIGVGSWSIQYGQPDFTVTSFTVGTIGVAHSGAYLIPITAIVKNQGTVGVKGINWWDELYLSTDATLDSTDVVLGNSTSTPDFPAGSTYTRTFTGTTPSTTAVGNYTAFFKTDGWDAGGTYSNASDRVTESDETNNTASAAVTLPAGPDLAASNFSVGAITLNHDGSYSFPLTLTVTNNGPTTAKGSWWDYAYLSHDAVLDTSDVYLNYVTHGPDLAPGGSYVVTINVTTTATTAPGAYTVFAKTDGNNAGAYYTPNGQVTESDETNNIVSASITLPTPPDLVASNLSIGAITVNHDGSYSFPATFTVTNSGQAIAKSYWFDHIDLSVDATLDTTDIHLGDSGRFADVAPGASYTATVNAMTSTTTASGSYTLFAKTDGSNSGNHYAAGGLLAEADETNNTTTIAITLPTRPDLTTSLLSVGTITVNGDGSRSIPVTFTVTNNGGSTAKGGWFDECYLSSDGALDTTDAAIASLYHSVDLAPSAHYSVSLTCRAAAAATAGSYTLFVKADGNDSGGKYSASGIVTESDETNNSSSQAIVLP